MAGLRQLEPVVKKIGDYTFYLKPLPAMTAVNLSGDLASLLMPLVSGFLPLIDEKDGKSMFDVDVSQAAAAMSKSMEGFSGQKVETMMRKLLITYQNVVVELPEYDGDVETGRIEKEYLTQDIVNEIFCGEVQNMFVLAYYVIAQNFNGFFRKFAPLSGQAIEASAKKIRKIL